MDVIEVKGGTVNELTVSVSITPSDSGLAWNPEGNYILVESVRGKYYHRIIMSGIKKQVIII